MSRRILFIIQAAVLVSLSVISCKKDIISGDDPSVPSQESGNAMMTLPSIAEDSMTKVSSTITDSGLGFSWSKDDIVGVYSLEGSLSTFHLRGGEGSSRGVFDGGGFDLKKGAKYYALYPYDGTATSLSDVLLDYRGQKLSADLSKSSLGRHAFMVSSATVSDSGNASFGFNHLTAFAQMPLGTSEKVSLGSLSILPVSGQIVESVRYDIKSSSVKTQAGTSEMKISLEQTDSDSREGLWVALAPQDLSRSDLAVVYSSENDIFSVRLPGKNFSAGKAYRFSQAPVRWAVESSVKGISAVPLSQVKLSDMDADASFKDFIPESGLYQFSGITPISQSGGVYEFALVTDKAKGGGLLKMSAKISSDGQVSDVRLSPFEGTRTGTVARDPEGVVRLGNNYLVSGEDQKILEYDSSGNPTGRQVEVPSDLSLSSVQNNMGFESLAYDSKSTIYTVTEGALSEDMGRTYASSGALLRIQSFDSSSLKPAKRYLYLMDAPYFTSVKAGATYVHGVSDMTALPDGRLVVMEREVYTNIPTMMASSRVKLYVVDPAADHGGILSKSLLCQFTTGIDVLTRNLHVANYEGMCHITLPDGTPALLLVNDAQGRPSYNVAGKTVFLENYMKIIRLGK